MRGKLTGLVLASALLAAVIAASLALGSTGASTSTMAPQSSRLVAFKQWVWQPSLKGYVVDLEYSSGILYALIDSEGPLVYAFNASTGRVLWASRIAVRETPLSMLLLGKSMLVVTENSEGNKTYLTLYRGGEGGFSPVFTFNLTKPLYRVLAAYPTPAGDIVVAGARYHLGFDYQYFIGLASRGGLLWSKYWGGKGSDYLNLVAIGPDQSICAAGYPPILVCLQYTGDTTYLVNLTFTPLALLDLGSGEALVAGVGNASGRVELVKRGSIAWSKSTGAFIPSALSASREAFTLAGVLAPKPYRLAVLLLNSTGELEAFAYSNETNQSLLVLAASRGGGLVYVGGSSGGAPFIEAIAIASVAVPTTTPGGGAASGGVGGHLILIEEIALAVSAGLLALTLALFKPWRWLKRK